MNPEIKRAADYLENVGGSILVEMFDDDHEPIGPLLRHNLVSQGVAREEAGVIFKTDYEDGIFKK
jgi:hypothetical protein